MRKATLPLLKGDEQDVKRAAETPGWDAPRHSELRHARLFCAAGDGLVCKKVQLVAPRTAVRRRLFTQNRGATSE